MAPGKEELGTEEEGNGEDLVGEVEGARQLARQQVVVAHGHPRLAVRLAGLVDEFQRQRLQFGRLLLARQHGRQHVHAAQRQRLQSVRLSIIINNNSCKYSSSTKIFPS